LVIEKPKGRPEEEGRYRKRASERGLNPAPTFLLLEKGRKPNVTASPDQASE